MAKTEKKADLKGSSATTLLYRIEWESKATGATGHGQPISKDAAIAAARQMDEIYPKITHKAVAV